MTAPRKRTGVERFVEKRAAGRRARRFARRSDAWLEWSARFHKDAETFANELRATAELIAAAPPYAPLKTTAWRGFFARLQKLFQPRRARLV